MWPFEGLQRLSHTKFQKTPKCFSMCCFAPTCYGRRKRHANTTAQIPKSEADIKPWFYNTTKVLQNPLTKHWCSYPPMRCVFVRGLMRVSLLLKLLHPVMHMRILKWREARPKGCHLLLNILRSVTHIEKNTHSSAGRQDRKGVYLLLEILRSITHMHTLKCREARRKGCSPAS
jgi:hypothetical protein